MQTEFRSIEPLLRRLAWGGLLLLSGSLARAATITVNSTLDAAANDGQCTLREAIIAGNTNAASGGAAGECAAGDAGSDTIAFNIPGAGVRTVTFATTPPAITEMLFINGFSQPGASANTNPLNAGINAVVLIELNHATVAGLAVNAAGSVIRGLNIHGIGDEITVNADNVTIAGNFLGTNPAGTAKAGPSGSNYGITAVLATNGIFGGPAAADRNLLSGDDSGAIRLSGDSGTLIQGNYIGTDITGTLAIGSSLFGSTIVDNGSTSNTMLLGNLISGSVGGGVQLSGAGVIQGNLIGTQRDGVSPLGNNSGLLLGANNLGASGFLVGGTAAGQGNVIAFNQVGIVIAFGSPGHRILGNSIFSHVFKGISLTSSSIIPLANDPCDPDTVFGNAGQNYPVITSAVPGAGTVAISGTLNSTASTAFRVEFFSNSVCNSSGNGEGKTFLGFAAVTTDASCNATFGPVVFAVPAGQAIFTATATDPANNTSEFSTCFPPAIVVSPTATPTATSTGTIPATSSPTSTPVVVVATSTPTPVTTGQGPAGGPTTPVPTLSPKVLVVFGLALALSAIFLFRRTG
ncbi:MAG: CSLREA domain-containing protein [Acidobacteriota bacterium]